MKLLMLSHGSLAHEMKKTAKMILGDFENVFSLGISEGQGIADFEENLVDAIVADEETLILTDLFGGSPFLTSAKIYNQAQNNEFLQIVTGMNLPMVLEVISNKDNYTLVELGKFAKKCGYQGIKNVIEEVKGGIS